MTFKEIKDLIELLKESNLAEFNIRKEDFELRIKTDKYSRKVSVSTGLSSPQQPIQMVSAPGPSSAPVPDLPAASEGLKESASKQNLVEIKSPIVGTFYRSSGPDKPAYVKVGDVIEEGSVVCIVEAMKLFNEIESEVSGTIVKVLVEDASPVEYDQPLFLVEA
jgi:acetyl-CoA carboxylase biotin carboxyl carrier protein